MTPEQIKSHFHLNRDNYDGEVFIQIQAKNPEVRRRLMNGIYLEDYDKSFHYDATPEEPNTQTLARRIFVKVFQKNEIDLKK
jgi:hypothetical protein